MHNPDSDAAVAPISVREETWEPLVRQRWFIAVFVLSAMATALLLTYVYSEKYESSTAISYRVQEVTRFKAQQSEAMGSPAPQAPFKVIGQTLQEVLRSDAILGDVVAALHLDEKLPPPEGTPFKVWYEQTKQRIRDAGRDVWMLLKFGRIVKEDPTMRAIQDLRDNLKVSNRDSYVFQLDVRDRYPDRAARIADHLAQVLAAWLLEFDRQPGRSRADQLKALLDEKESTMRQLRKEIEFLLTENQVASVPLEIERLTVNLSTLQLEASRLDGDIAQVQQRQLSVDSKLAAKERILADSGAATGKPEPATPVERIAPDDFRKLASQKVFEGVELSSLLAKRAALQTSIDSISTRLRKLPGIQNRLDALKLSLASTEREFAMLNDGYQEASVRATSPVSEVRVLHPAVVPTGPVAPIKVYHVLLAGALALLFATGLVYLLAFLGIGILFPSRPAPHAERLAAAAADPVLPGGAGAHGHE